MTKYKHKSGDMVSGEHYGTSHIGLVIRVDPDRAAGEGCAGEGWPYQMYWLKHGSSPQLENSAPKWFSKNFVEALERV